MATRRRFSVGDEVNVKGIVRLIDMAGPGTITIARNRNCPAITMQEDNDAVEAVGKAPQPKGRSKLI